MMPKWIYTTNCVWHQRLFVAIIEPAHRSDSCWL